MCHNFLQKFRKTFIRRGFKTRVWECEIDLQFNFIIFFSSYELHIYYNHRSIEILNTYIYGKKIVLESITL